MTATADAHAADKHVILLHQAANGAYPACPSFTQYPHVWLRDGSFIAHAMDLVGEHASAARFHAWVASTILHHEAELRALVDGAARGASFDEGAFLPARYAVDGGWRNDGWPAFQLAGYGLWLWSLCEHAATNGSAPSDDLARAADLVARYVAAFWDEPCYDVWEEHRSQLHTSTLASTLAGLRAYTRLGIGADERVASAIASLEAMLRDECVVDGRFVKYVANPVVDASLLWLATPLAVVAADDPRMVATVAEIERTLVVDGGLMRFATDTFYGGGAWILLTAWLGWHHARRGEHGRARACLEWIERQRDAAGLLPEQVPTARTNPRFLRYWTRRWGTSAKPLLWSHAMTIVLRAALEPDRAA